MPSEGFRLATVRGIPIRLHPTLLLGLPIFAFIFARAFRSAALVAGVSPDELAAGPWLWGLALALGLFGSVLIHELAHALYGRRKGVRIHGISLLMIGGVARMADAPRTPRDEAMIALVGPIASFALAGLCYLGQGLLPESSLNLRFAIFSLGGLNLVLALFNLLPAFPMDGGRILRAVLVPRLGSMRATRVASAVGKVFALGFGIWGVLTFNVLLLLIAFFVYFGAESERQGVVANALLGRLQVRDVMNAAIRGISSRSAVQEVAERMVRERQVAFPVVDEHGPSGVVTLGAVRRVPVDRRRTVTVAEIAVKGEPPLSPDDDATTALRRLGASDLPEMTVVEDDQVVGVVTRDDLARGLMLSELDGRPGSRSSVS